MAGHNGVYANQIANERTVSRTHAVSVVIPTYNRAHAVAEAIESALAQTCMPTEVIVVDDGSTDGTAAHLARYMDRIVYIYQENQGVSVARNTGIHAANGDLIAFLDSDDVWHPRKLELQLCHLDEHPDTALVGAVSFRHPDRSWPSLPDAASLICTPLVFEDIVFGTPFPTSTAVVRRRCFDEVGYFNPGLRNAEDRDLYIRIGSRFQIVKLSVVLAWGGRAGEHLSMGSTDAEQSTRTMIHNAFNQVESLRGRFFLRQRSLSKAALEASYMYQVTGHSLRALSRIVRSLVLWPLPYPPEKQTRRFARIQTLIVIVLRILHLRQ